MRPLEHKVPISPRIELVALLAQPTAVVWRTDLLQDALAGFDRWCTRKYTVKVGWMMQRRINTLSAAGRASHVIGTRRYPFVVFLRECLADDGLHMNRP